MSDDTKIILDKIDEMESHVKDIQKILKEEINENLKYIAEDCFSK